MSDKIFYPEKMKKEICSSAFPGYNSATFLWSGTSFVEWFEAGFGVYYNTILVHLRYL